MIIHPNLKLWTFFTGNSNDLSGNLSPGSNTNVSYPAGIYGTSILYNNTLTPKPYTTIGSTAYFSFMHHPANFTVCVWVYSNDGTVEGGIITNSASTVNKGIYIGTGNKSSKDVAVYVFKGVAGVTSCSAYTASNVLTQTWQHLAIAVNVGSSICNIYINGVLQSSTNTFSSTNSGDSSFVMALGRYQYSTPGAYWYGNLDDLQIYNVLLPISDIRRIMQGKHPFTRS